MGPQTGRFVSRDRLRDVRIHLSSSLSLLSSNLSSRDGNRIRTAIAIALLAFVSSTYTLAESGFDTYKSKCSACHGARGAGDTMLGKNLKLRSLASDDVQKQSDDELFAIISKGKKRMPPFDRKLSKDQIRDLVKYVRSLKK
jgi:mono/diheme cytochrome c family protein